MDAAAAGFPPGYRFYPTEEELICFYLRNKLDNLRDDIERVIPVVDVYAVDPPQLPGATHGVAQLTLRSELSLCRLYTKSGTLRQFDRRPLAAAAGVVPPGEEPAGPSTAAAASSPPDDDDGSGTSMQQQQLEIGASDPYGDDVAMLDALLYWPGD
ncbi:hypothetical protein HU200_026207 [Digitaria exilis]|uniref:NAC domain-containing protein n=1 Tax=Digitaria exilis TaxID=1010633 RepID=A0A835C092_9POAL|nr:hypothetical protein HU200_026207 [Digitaria exilis]